MNTVDFWSRDDAKSISAEAAEITNQLNVIKSINDLYDNIEILEELKADDSELETEYESTLAELNKQLKQYDSKEMFTGPYDKDDAVITLHAGAGGSEACDWTSMLFRMYVRFAEKHHLKVNILDSLDGDVAGLKMITFELVGKNAYGLFKSEHGVHRLVRQSPFNANNKRQTSFSSCSVMPEIDTDINIEIDKKDLRIDTFCSSGAGGQNVNKVSSAVRIVHIPTNIVVTCQNERDQIKNKEKALKILKSKLYMIEAEKKESELNEIRGTISDINFGQQIRSYVLHPYTLVKDHRTNYETHNTASVLDGNLDDFINAFLDIN